MLKDQLTFGFEQTFTIPEWWGEPGFVSTSDTPKKREMMKAAAEETAQLLKGRVVESVDIWDHLQYEVKDAKGETRFYVTMDPGSIETKTPPCLFSQIEEVNAPMFQGAKAAGLVTYRNWWYGVKGGTEGGCHVNMGGMTPATNPLRQHPELIVRYFAWLHSHPEFHYPFMGPDTGPGGNSQRMDEFAAPNALDPLEKLLAQKDLTAESVREALKSTTLVTEKSSFPSLTKYKGPDFLLEDRAQEAPYSAAELKLVCQWRLKLFERLLTEVPPLERFEPGYWHGHRLSSTHLWNRFIQTAETMGVRPSAYRVFFDRQFPLLMGGVNVPRTFTLREGRRPRVITDIKTRPDGTVVSKTVDTRHKRLELHASSWITAWWKGQPVSIDWHDGCAIIDLFVDDKDALLSIEGPTESATFSPFNMTWC